MKNGNLDFALQQSEPLLLMIFIIKQCFSIENRRFLIIFSQPKHIEIYLVRTIQCHEWKNVCQLLLLFLFFVTKEVKTQMDEPDRDPELEQCRTLTD